MMGMITLIRIVAGKFADSFPAAPQPSFQPWLPISYNFVIPAEAGIQWIKSLPRKRGNIDLLSASRDVCFCWIPASAGMTV